MSSLLTIALLAHAVAANPIYRRQAVTSSLTNATEIATVSLPETTDPAVTDTFTDIITGTYTETFFATGTETLTDYYPTPTEISSVYPTPTGGSNDGGYWICSFPPAGAEPTSTVTVTGGVPFPTVTETAVTTDPFSLTDATSFVESDTVVATTVTLTEPTATITESVDISITATTVLETDVPTATEAPVFAATAISDIVTETVLPTLSDAITTEIETYTADPTFSTVVSVITSAPSRVSTYTIVGPETTAVIRCVRYRPGYGHPHHPHPHPQPPRPTWTRSWPTERPTWLTVPTGTASATEWPSVSTTLDSVSLPVETITV